MIYKVARTQDDFDKASDCVNSCGYYDTVDLSTIGGLVMVAEDNGTVVGAVWTAVSGRMAILDYLAIRRGYSGLAIKLLVRLRRALEAVGIKQVRYTIHGRNIEAMRISEVMGGLNDFPYLVGCVNLEGNNGK